MIRIAAVGAMLALGTAQAQVPAELPSLLGVKIAPGQWREYRNVGGGPLYDGRRTRVAYFGTERVAGDPYQWIEYSSIGESPKQVTRDLVSLTNPGEVPVETIIDVDGPVNPASRPTCDPLEHRVVSYEEAGKKVVHVPAGTFETTVFTYRSVGVAQKAYVSTRDPKGIVLIETPTLRMELIAAGGGAKSQVHGPPLYRGPAACEHHSQNQAKWNALMGCLEQHVIAAAALGGESDYDSVWRRTTRLCNINASARMLNGFKASLEPIFREHYVEPRKHDAADGN